MRFLFIACMALIGLSSCRTERVINNNYLLNINDTTIRDSLAFKTPVIRKGDLLSIRVYSQANGLDPRVDAPFNLMEQGGSNGMQGPTGYLVNEKGDIEIPQVGTIHAEGMTREELEDLIKSKLVGLLNQPAVIVRYLNFRFTVLGEVSRPGTFNTNNEKLTILEALGVAGDITQYGQKKTVKVIREENGQKEIGTLDLTSDNMFHSPYFHLQQNDVVLVEQTRRRIRQEERQELVQQIGIASSIITAIALVLNLIR